MKKDGHQRMSTFWYPATARNMAGPGQSPAIPHPSPNRASPRKRFRSITLFVGTLNFPPSFFWERGHSNALEFYSVALKDGRIRQIVGKKVRASSIQQEKNNILTLKTLNPLTNWYEARLTKSPPPITQASVGSHSPVRIPLTFKNP